MSGVSGSLAGRLCATGLLMRYVAREFSHVRFGSTYRVTISLGSFLLSFFFAEPKLIADGVTSHLFRTHFSYRLLSFPVESYRILSWR